MTACLVYMHNQRKKYEMAALSMHAITVQDQGNAHYTDQDQTLL